MSELLAYQVATGVLALTTALAVPLWLIARERANAGRALVLLVIGRAQQALGRRGVPAAKALELVAPELRAAVERRGA